MRGALRIDEKAAIGIGSLIIFIAMILVAGIAASVIMQTMDSLEQQAMKTGQETIRDVANGVKVTHESGYSSGSKLTQLAIFVKTISGSDGVDLSTAYLSLSDSSSQVILSYDNTCYSNSVTNGLFSTLNSSNISSTEFGILLIRDSDSSCLQNTPVINSNDLAVLLVNTTACFSGIDTRTTVIGEVIPEEGMGGMFSFTTPSAYIDTIIDL